MTSTGEAVAALGVVADPARVIVVKPKADGRWAHYTLAECADWPVNGPQFLASALFLPGTVERYAGRVEANIERILWLPFDFDLSDAWDIPKEELFAYPDEALKPLVDGLRVDVEEVFGLLGLPIHRMDYTGYGLAVYVNVPPHDKSAVAGIRILHKIIVGKINTIARKRLADPQVCDAGTRIMRLVPCLNTKGATPRQSATLYRFDGVVDQATIKRAAGATAGAPPTRAVPTKGAALDAATVDQVIAAVAPHWTMGQRHHLTLALAGLLAKAGVPEEQTRSIIERLAAGDDEPWDRAKAVHGSYERVRSGLAVKGFYGLRETLPPELVDWLDGIAARVRQATTATPTVGGKRAEPKDDQRQRGPEYRPAPALAYRGWIGAYAALMEPTTEAPPAFHLGVALTFAGAVMGRHVCARYGSDPLYANLYTLLVGRSGRSRKDTSIKRATRLLTDQLSIGTRTLDLGVAVATDVGSAEGLIQVLKEFPNTMLYLTEFSKLMGNARRKNTGTIIPTLIEAFDTPPVMANLNKTNPLKALFPYLSILSATQPDILAGLMADEDIHSGFANRWFFVCGDGGEPIPVPPAVDRDVVTKLVFDLWDARSSYEEGTALEMAADARQRWEAWYVEDYRRQMTPEEEAMRVRHAVLIQKIALIYAVTERKREVGLDHLEAAIAVVEWMWGHVSVLLDTWGRSIDGQIEERIKTALADHGPMRRRELQQKCSSRKWSGTEFARTFKAMAENKTVVIDPIGFGGPRHRRERRLRA